MLQVAQPPAAAAVAVQDDYLQQLQLEWWQQEFEDRLIDDVDWDQCSFLQQLVQPQEQPGCSNWWQQEAQEQPGCSNWRQQEEALAAQQAQQAQQAAAPQPVEEGTDSSNEVQ